jgi:exodeoxyribonuclease V alpha subunit
MHPTSLSPTTPTELLSGLIERVTFHSPESGFCVLRVKARGHRDLITVVGHAAMISAGEWVTIGRQAAPGQARAVPRLHC